MVALSLVLGEGCRAPLTNTTINSGASVSSARSAPTATPVEEEGPRIELELLEPGHWRVTYQLERPAEKLRFWRAAQWFRESTWTVRTPGYELARDGNSQILALVEGATPTSTITVDVTDFTEVMDGEFRPMLPFSDGAVGLYTGHLYLRDVVDEVDGDGPYLQTLAVTTPANVALAISGSLLEGGQTTPWTDPHHDGTYIYFSAPGAKLEPLVTEHMTTIMDPGLPAAMKEQIQELLPPMFDALAAGHDATLPWRPMIIVAWEQGPEHGRHWEGGVRPGIIYMTLGGDDWERDDQESLIDLAHFVGHEASHFWNGSLIRNRSNADAWLSEGGADAVADLLLVHLELIDVEMLRARRERAVNRCLDSLRGTALRGADEHHGRGVYYPCGYLMAMWSDAAVGDPDLFAIWAALIERVGPLHDYDRHDYLSVLREMGADADLIDRMEDFITNDSDTQRSDIIEGFSRAGLALTPGNRPPASERPRLAGKAVAHLQRASCGRTSVSTFDTHLTTHALSDCDSFSTKADIYAIAGQSVADGDRAFDRVRTACAKGRSVKLADRHGAEILSVPCKTALPERLAWLKLR